MPCATRVVSLPCKIEGRQRGKAYVAEVVSTLHRAGRQRRRAGTAALTPAALKRRPAHNCRCLRETLEVMAMAKTAKATLALGPVLYLWQGQKWRDFYFRIADEAPVSHVYLGETVCSKRFHFTRVASGRGDRAAGECRKTGDPLDAFTGDSGAGKPPTSLIADSPIPSRRMIFPRARHVAWHAACRRANGECLQCRHRATARLAWGDRHLPAAGGCR